MAAADSLVGFRLSPQQRRAWRWERASHGAAGQCVVRLRGEVERDRLRDALRQVVRRHQVLRTVFPRTAGTKLPLQVILEESDPQWCAIDLAGLEAGAQEARIAELRATDVERSFDLERGPMLRARLAALSPFVHLLVLTVPALCADARTYDLLVEEVARGCAGGLPETDDEALQYLQFSEWQNDLAGEAGRTAVPAGDLRLPHELPACSRDGWSPGRVRWTLDAPAVDRIAELAASQGAAVQDVVLTCWQVLLARLTGSADPGVGVLFDGRIYEELAGIFGPLARWIPVPGACAPDLELREVLARTRQSLEQAARGQEELATDGPSGEESEPLCFAAGFEAHAPLQEHRAGGVEFTVEDRRASLERFKVCLSWQPLGRGATLELLYDPASLPEFAALEMAEQLRRLLDRAPEEAGTRIGWLDLLSPAERHRLVTELNDTASAGTAGASPSAALTDLAARRPGDVALVCGDETWTFRELDERTSRLAGRLVEAGVGPDRLVGVCLDRSPGLLTALLAVLRAGGAYVPLDPASPPARLRAILEDCGASHLLTQESYWSSLEAEGLRVICLDGPAAEAPGPEECGVFPRPEPDHLAYVIYTSGSTGRPKGVMISRGGMEHYLGWAARTYAGSGAWGSVLHSPVAFDLAVTSLFGPLLCGKPVILLPEGSGMDALGAALGTGLDFLKLTPAQLDMLAGLLPEDSVPRMAALVLGGEELKGESLAFWRRRSPSLRVINEYGPTETVVGCCVHEVPEGEPAPGPVAIGHPISNVRLYLLDRELQPVLSGAPGELYIGGAGMARGYLRAPAMTAAAFLPDPFGDAPGGRLYRSGDLARLRADGTLEFLGRIDHQVKVRGFRIEPGEIEAQVAQHPSVREAVVVAREDVPGDKRLVVYWVPRAGTAPPIQELREFLRERLPEPMLPSTFVLLDELPLARSGKVDRRALPAPGTERPGQAARYVPPETPREEEMAAIWCEILRLEKIGVEDSFFDLGGHSLLATQLLSRIRSSFGVSLGLEDFFRYPTVRGLTSRTEEMLLAGMDGADLGAMLEALDGIDEEEARRLLAESAAVPTERPGRSDGGRS